MPCSCCGCYFLILRQLLRQTLARVWARGEACKKHLLRKTWLWCREHPKNYGTLMLVTQQLQQGNKMTKINVKKKLVHELMAIWDTYSETAEITKSDVTQQNIEIWVLWCESSFLFGVAHAPFACQRWGLPHRLAQCATPGKGLV